jgi:hypothetical protein
VYASAAISFLPVVYEPPRADFGPPLLPDRSDELTAYVVGAVGEGRPLFDVLADAFVLDRVDEYVSVLDHLAYEPAVRAALADQAAASALPALTLIG